MSYRENIRTAGERFQDIERRLRALEQPGPGSPDPDWVLTVVESSGTLHYLYIPTQSYGPAIGTK